MHSSVRAGDGRRLGTKLFSMRLAPGGWQEWIQAALACLQHSVGGTCLLLLPSPWSNPLGWSGLAWPFQGQH